MSESSYLSTLVQNMHLAKIRKSCKTEDMNLKFRMRWFLLIHSSWSTASLRSVRPTGNVLHILLLAGYFTLYQFIFPTRKLVYDLG